MDWIQDVLEKWKQITINEPVIDENLLWKNKSPETEKFFQKWAGDFKEKNKNRKS